MTPTSLIELDDMITLSPCALANRLRQWLLAYELDQIFRLEESFYAADVTLEKRQKRIVKHFCGLAHVINGSLMKAKLELEEAQKKYGGHIGILRDLSAVHYQIGEIDLWRTQYQELADRLEKLRSQLSTETILSCELILAKYYEEEGLVARALSAYEDCYRVSSNELEKKHSSTNEGLAQKRWLCLAQIIRLKALYRQTVGLGGMYKELVSRNEAHLNTYTHFEIHHALMLAEISLVGVEHAWSRVKTSLADTKLKPHDRRLIFFDFVEEARLQNASLSEEVSRYVPNMDGALTFEKEMFRLCFSESERLNPVHLNQMAPDLTWAGYLRLLSLYFVDDPRSSRGQEIKNMFMLALEAVEENSRPFWVQRLMPFLGEEELKIRFDKKRRRLCFLNKELDLSRKRSMLAVVEHLSHSPQQSVEELIDRLWNCDYSPEHYHRLRMTIHRLNQQLFDLTAITKSVEINAEQVEVKSSIQFVVEGSEPKSSPN
jgi:hypothetical protein